MNLSKFEQPILFTPAACNLTIQTVKVGKRTACNQFHSPGQDRTYPE